VPAVLTGAGVAKYIHIMQPK